jgi:hypothetical protein
MSWVAITDFKNRRVFIGRIHVCGFHASGEEDSISLFEKREREPPRTDTGSFQGAVRTVALLESDCNRE